MVDWKYIVKWGNLFVFCFFAGMVMAQNDSPKGNQEELKQTVFCNQDIKWAGIAELDIVLGRKAGQTWDNYKASGYSDLNYKQYLGDTILQDSLLMKYIITSIQQQKTPIYQTSHLKQPKTLTKEDWNAIYLDDFDRMVSRKYALEDFEVVRLQCFIVYDNQGFDLWPLAAAPIRVAYDIYPTTAAFEYHPLGWIPIQNKAPQQKTWQKNIHSAIQLKNIQVFKQDWTYQQVVKDLIQKNQQNSSQYPLYKADNLAVSEVLSQEQMEEIITYEDIIVDPDTFEEVFVRTPYEEFGLVGMNVSLEWTWDEKKQQLHVQPVKFSPIAHNMDILCEDCEGENMYLYRLFSEKK